MGSLILEVQPTHNLDVIVKHPFTVVIQVAFSFDMGGTMSELQCRCFNDSSSATTIITTTVAAIIVAIVTTTITIITTIIVTAITTAIIITAITVTAIVITIVVAFPISFDYLG